MMGGHTLSSPRTQEVTRITVDGVTAPLITPITAVLLPVTHPASVDTDPGAAGELLNIVVREGFIYYH